MTDKEAKGRAELEANVAIQKIHVSGDTIARVWGSTAKWGALAFVALMSERAIAHLAGRSTLAIFDFSALVSIEGLPTAAGLLGFAFGFGGIAYGRSQAKLRRDTVERLHQFQVKYERTIDPGRTSSRLMPRGETRPEDDHE